MTTTLQLIDEIAALPGRNEIERANHYLCTNEPGHESLNYSEQIWRAKTLLSNLDKRAHLIQMSAAADPSATKLNSSKNQVLQKLQTPEMRDKCAQLTNELKRATADGDAEGVVKIVQSLNELLNLGELEEDLREEDIDVEPSIAKELIKNCGGGSMIQKSQIYLSARHPSFNKLPLTEQVWRASQFIRTGFYSGAK